MKQSPEKQLEIIQSFDSENFDMIWRFLFGILFNQLKPTRSQHENKLINMLTTVKRCLIISHCAFEAQDEIVNRIVCSSFFKIAVLEDIFRDPNMRSAGDILHFISECNQTDFGD